MLILGGGEYQGSVGSAMNDRQVEVLSPATGLRVRDCAIDPLPEARRYHTINNGTVCGGGTSSTQSSCIELQPDGTWVLSHFLKKQRFCKKFYNSDLWQFKITALNKL